MVAAHYVPALFDAPPKAIADSSPGLTAQVRALMASLGAGKLPAGLAPELGARFTPAHLANLKERYDERGPLQTVELLSSEPKEGGRSLRYRFRYANETMLVSVLVDQAGQFSQLGSGPE